MSSLTNTHPGLLVQIRKPNNERAWEEFIERYAPYVYHYCRKYGLQDADAADVVQDVLQAVARAISSFRRLYFQGGRGLTSCALRLLIALSSVSSFERFPVVAVGAFAATSVLLVFEGANANGGGGLGLSFRAFLRFVMSAFSFDLASERISSFHIFFCRLASFLNHCPASPTLYLQQFENMSIVYSKQMRSVWLEVSNTYRCK